LRQAARAQHPKKLHARVLLNRKQNQQQKNLHPKLKNNSVTTAF